MQRSNLISSDFGTWAIQSGTRNHHEINTVTNAKQGLLRMAKKRTSHAVTRKRAVNSMPASTAHAAIFLQSMPYGNLVTASLKRRHAQAKQRLRVEKC
jgi:hypothetical protein